jgi:integrase/recombinase XerD
MAGRRPLTPEEERRVLHVVRNLDSRDRALVTTLSLTGFRISECLALELQHVERHGVLVDKIGLAPRYLKGARGRTRWVPVLPELARALTSHLASLRRRFVLSADFPLFLSREAGPGDTIKPITADMARRLVHRVFEEAGVPNDGRLGCHTFRKTWARHVLKNSGNNVAVVQKALAHSSLEVTQRYIDIEEDEVFAAVRKCDFTRKPRKAPAAPAELIHPLPASPGGD